MQKLRKLFLLIRALPKTIYFNFHYFPFKQALKLPLLISHHVILRETKGKVILTSPARTFMVRIGFSEHVFFSDYKLNSTWSVAETGTVIFAGTAFIGNGTRFFVLGKLTIENNMIISASAKIQCFERITFGNDVLVGWDCVFMDTDGHAILDEQEQVINHSKSVIIGNKVWIGARSFITKGVNLGPAMIVASNSVVLKSFDLPNHVIGGYPAKVIKSNVSWRG